MPEKLPRPILVCSGCKRPTRFTFAVNERHLEYVDGNLCVGTFRLAPRDHSWAECEACGATGLAGEFVCGDCDGHGWRFIDEEQQKGISSAQGVGKLSSFSDSIQCGPAMMTDAPTRQITTPAISQRSGTTPSTIQSQASDEAM